MDLKTFHELLGRQGGGAKFTNDDPGRMVGDFRCFLGSGTGAERKRVEGDGGVSRPGDIEDFPGAGGGVIGRSLPVEKNDAMFPQGDEEGGDVESLQKQFSDRQERFVTKGGVGRSGVGLSSHGKGLGAIGFECGDTGPEEGVARIWIGGDDLMSLHGHLADAIDKVLGEKSFPIVFKNHPVHVGQEFGDALPGGIQGGGRGRKPLLPIHPDDLLLAGDNAGFDDRRHPLDFDESIGGDVLRSEEGFEVLGVGVAADGPADLDRLTKWAQIAGHIGGSAGITRLALDLHHRHGGFGRNAGNFSPDKFVQHDVSDHQQPLPAGLLKKVLYSFGIHLIVRALLPGSRLQAKLIFAMLSRLIPVVFCGIALAKAPAQEPAQHVDLTKFPAAAVDDVVVPVPSEVFNVLDKLGSPNWNAEMRDNLGKNSGDRAQVALLLGTVIADGFIAVEAENAERVKDIGQEVLTLADAINVRKAVIARSKSITEKADAKNWSAVRSELDGALQDVKGAMEELGDEDLAQLVSLGGWIRGTEVLTSIVGKNYTLDGAQLLCQPELVNYFSRRVDAMRNSRLKKSKLVQTVRRLLKDIRPLIKRETIPIETVQKIHTMTNKVVIVITTQES